MSYLFDLGLIAMSAKPYHIGHDFLIKQASNMCLHVNVYVSTSDRKRNGEFFISGKAMEKIWKSYLIPNMPENVNIYLSKTSPIKDLYSFISKNKDVNIGLFSDIKDKIKCDLENVENILYERNKESPNISGKTMRDFLKNCDLNSFKNFLPSFIKDEEKIEIYNILKPKPVGFIQIF